MDTFENRQSNKREAPSSPEEATLKMRRVLEKQAADLEAKKVTSLEEGLKKKREIANLRSTLKKLETPALAPQVLAKERLDAFPKEIESMRDSRKAAAQKMNEPEKIPWWKKVFTIFKKDEPQKLSLDYMQSRNAVRNAEKAQSAAAYEYAKRLPKNNTRQETREVSSTQATPQEELLATGEGTDTQELEAVNY